MKTQLRRFTKRRDAYTNQEKIVSAYAASKNKQTLRGESGAKNWQALYRTRTESYAYERRAHKSGVADFVKRERLKRALKGCYLRRSIVYEQKRASPYKLSTEYKGSPVCRPY